MYKHSLWDNIFCSALSNKENPISTFSARYILSHSCKSSVTAHVFFVGAVHVCLFVFVYCISHVWLITAGAANCPRLGGLGSSLHLLRRKLGSLTCLRMTLLEHGTSIYSMIRTACQPDQIASLYHAWLRMWHAQMGAEELVKSSYTRS